jgi:predicted DNA-binding transcriptional regulator AlpA
MPVSDQDLSAAPIHPKTRACELRAARPLPVAIALLSRADVARALGVSPLTVYRYTKAGLLRSLKLGDGGVRASVRYRASDVAELIESRLAE